MDNEIATVLAPLQQVYIKFQTILKDIETLSEQAKWGEARTHITEVTEHAQNALKYASTAMDKAKSNKVASPPKHVRPVLNVHAAPSHPAHLQPPVTSGGGH